MNVFEIEIKSLLGAPEKADELREKLQVADPKMTKVGSHKQLNHYFINGDVDKLYKLIIQKLSSDDKVRLREVIDTGTDFSIRTRLTDDRLFFVIKASVDEGTSHNTVSRIEFESEISGMTLDDLDALIQKAGFEYQAKWSREREEYVCRDINVCLDKNAGYGYLAEFEKVVNDEASVLETQKELRSFMKELEIEELSQDRLERMFEFYNKNWPDYYGTEKIFIIE